MLIEICVFGMLLCGCGLFFGGRARERRMRTVIDEQNRCLCRYAGCIVDLLDELERRLELTEEERAGIDGIRSEVSMQSEIWSRSGIN